MRRLLLASILGVCLPGSAGASFTVTGVFEFEDKGWNYNGWNGNDPMRPIRYADVSVINDNNGQVLGSGSTQLDGSFSILCNSVGTTDIVVRVDADTNLHSSQRIRVLNLSFQEYSAFSPVFSNHNTNNDLDVGTTSVLKILSGSSEANPFNMLDMGVAMWEYITGPLVGAGNTSTPTILWPNFSGSFASGSTTWIDVDDGYDDAVILHELGHIAHNRYSDSDSPGGTHFIGDSDQDPRLSLGEGYATFMAGVTMQGPLARIPIYFDGNAALQNGGVQIRMKLENAEPFANELYGCADEGAVAVTLYDLIDDENSADNSPVTDDDSFTSTTLINGLTTHQAWWDVFTGPMAFASNVTFNHVWEGWFSEHGVGGNHAELEALFQVRRIQFFNDADEPNDSSAAAIPVTPSENWSGNRNLYAGVGDPPITGPNDEDWYETFLLIGSQIDVELRYPNASGDANTQADTNLRLIAPSGAFWENENAGQGRNGAVLDFVVPETGLWRFRVRTNDSIRRYGRYNYRIRYDLENLVPQYAVGPTANPPKLNRFQDSTQLSVTINDAQAVTYTWTPLDGGQVLGSGPEVTFVPPKVTEITDFEIQLEVEDSLGAEADPVTVTVTVDPLEYQEDFPLFGTRN